MFRQAKNGDGIATRWTNKTLRGGLAASFAHFDRRTAVRSHTGW
jgi:hypothetical protein